MKRLDRQSTRLKAISRAAERIDNNLASQISSVEDQVNAVITSDVELLEELADEHFVLQRDFKMLEKIFVDELRVLLKESDSSANGIKEQKELRLSKLKTEYPEASNWVDEARRKIGEGIENLKMKQEQLLHLLQFAMDQNSAVMESIYRLHNRKAVQYGSDGEENGSTSGVAVNQKA